MSPLPIPTTGAGLDHWAALLEPRSHWSIILLVSLFAAALQSVVFILGKRKKRATVSDRNLEGSSMDHEGLLVKQRKDSSQNEESDLSKSMLKCSVTELKEQHHSETQSHDKARWVSPEQNQNNHLESLKQETLEPSRLPIYPWIAPPKRLPGPYDAPYYPLPLPTIAVKRTAQNDTQHQPSMNKVTSDDRPEELETIVYSRRIAAKDALVTEPMREGVITVSTKGWRRTQWTVNAG